MNNKYWYKFTEYNDNEGETWHFFIHLTEEEHSHLEYLIREYQLDSYYLSKTALPELEVDILVKHSDSGYMNTYNKRPAPYPMDIKALPTDGEELDDLFYKGGFW